MVHIVASKQFCQMISRGCAITAFQHGMSQVTVCSQSLCPAFEAKMLLEHPAIKNPEALMLLRRYSLDKWEALEYLTLKAMMK